MDFKTVIQASGKTRSEIIREVGCSQGYLSLLEQDKRKVGKKYLAKFAAALGVLPQDLRPDLALLLSPSLPQKHGHAKNTVQPSTSILRPEVE